MGSEMTPTLKLAVHQGAYLRLCLGKQPPPQNLPPAPPKPPLTTVQGLMSQSRPSHNRAECCSLGSHRKQRSPPVGETPSCTHLHWLTK